MPNHTIDRARSSGLRPPTRAGHRGRLGVFVRAIPVLLFAMLVSSRVLITEGTAVPLASFNVGVPEQATKKGVLDRIDQTLIGMGFTLKENDWKAWESILSSEEFENKKHERRYSFDRFELFYRPDSLEYIRLSFYEHDQRQFTTDGKSKYYGLKSAFLANEIVLLEATERDVQIGRPVTTPEQFNKSHPLPTTLEKTKQWGFLAASLLMSIAVIFLPAWYLLKKASTKTSISIMWKRIGFTTISAFFLFPLPLPLSMFGPLLLVPGVFLLPTLFDLPAQYLQYSIVSFVVALVLSSIASLAYVQKTP